MKKLFLILIVAAFVILFPKSLSAQSGSLNFTSAFPMGEFKNNLDKTGFGIGGSFMFWLPTSDLPVSVGLNIGFINYGNELRREPFSSTIPDVTVDVERSNNLVNFHLLFQVGATSGVVRPYAEALFGGSYLFTETQILSRGNDEVASSTNFDDFAWSYGGGAGFLIQLTDNEMGDFSSIFLDIKARYLFGSSAEYLKEGSVRINNGRVSYDVSKSKTDMLTAQIGVTAYFNSISF
ncbi:MAG: hypothetical protein IPM56_15480 [Ignavibacteriales bacterium]|nr:MAG: hypothetical protein IPM56_15480 [Ignavibacteriales bacterium]